MGCRGHIAAALLLAVTANGTVAAQPAPGAAKSSAELEQELAANKAAQAALEAQLSETKRIESEATLQRYAAMAEEVAAARAFLESQAPPPAPAGEAAAPDPNVFQETTTTTETAPDGTETTKEVVKTYSQAALRDSETGKQSFGGIEFGIGLAFGYDIGKEDRVKEAILDENQIVRVSDLENVSARLILESHYLFTPVRGVVHRFMRDVFALENNADEPTWGFGPFVAIQPGEDDIISAIGGGLMFGFRRKGTESQSFNVGIGVLYDLNVRLLGEGISPNQPLPTGETEIRYREEEQSGLLIMTSYSF